MADGAGHDNSIIECSILAVFSGMGCPLLAVCSGIERCIMWAGIDGNLLSALRPLCIAVT